MYSSQLGLENVKKFRTLSVSLAHFGAFADNLLRSADTCFASQCELLRRTNLISRLKYARSVSESEEGCVSAPETPAVLFWSLLRQNRLTVSQLSCAAGRDPSCYQSVLHE
jgi:hypothetical protein